MSLPKPPSHWPSEVRYLLQPHVHASVPPHVRADLGLNCTQRSAGQQRGPQKGAVVIRLITEPSHPAFGQRGLFAAKKIEPHTHILDYIGEVHCDDRPESDYDLSLYRVGVLSVGVDASRAGNEARFVNDYRGVRIKPNVVFQDRRTESGELRMSVWSGSEVIRKGDELLVSYGKAWWRARRTMEDELSPEEDIA